MQHEQRDAEQAKRMPEVILHGRLVDGEQVRHESRLERMRTERAQHDSRRKREGGEKQAKFSTHGRDQLTMSLYNDGLHDNDTTSKDSTMSIERFHIGKRLAGMVVHNGTIYLAGQVPDDTSADITGQTKQVLATIDGLLAEAGSDKSKLLSATIYLPDMADFPAMNVVWEAWVTPGKPPARATVQAALAGPAYKVEIQVIAAV
jgi:enamine deaminase RidA (YjgF/YER057c/UK114 family)